MPQCCNLNVYIYNVTQQYYIFMLFNETSFKSKGKITDTAIIQPDIISYWLADYFYGVFFFLICIILDNQSDMFSTQLIVKWKKAKSQIAACSESWFSSQQYIMCSRTCDTSRVQEPATHHVFSSLGHITCSVVPQLHSTTACTSHVPERRSRELSNPLPQREGIFILCLESNSSSDGDNYRRNTKGM